MTQVIRSEMTFPSSAGLGEIFVRAWEPEGGNPKAAVQIVHGMAEHGERYEGFAHALVDDGFAVWCMDLAGHGKSVKDDGDLGYFGSNNGVGWKTWIWDVKRLFDHIHDRYGDSVPLLLFGHSMGSFIAKAYVEKYAATLAGACFCGTADLNPAASAGILVSQMVISSKGAKYKSAFLDNLLFDSNNAKIENPVSKFDWLNTDPAEVAKYDADPYCGFLFSAAGYLDLLSLMKSATRRSWYSANIPHRFPMLLIAGDADPIGGYGKGVLSVLRRMRNAGKKNSSAQIFEGMRHEILLHPEKQKVYDTVIKWMNESCLKNA
ncbi:MAG: lysophospholipase [Oscillospiraceae bacterium]|jgi:alpha-beta hydrolase superfamily lysophospholipase|nr:lysophospholipase [Oscillospiraceae bacterium]